MKQLKISITGPAPAEDDPEFVSQLLGQVAGDAEHSTDGAVYAMDLSGESKCYDWTVKVEDKPVVAAEPGPEFTITIAGRHGSGKSALAQLIVNSLRTAGVQSIKVLNEDTTPEHLAATYDQRLAAVVGKNPQITLDMVQLRAR